MKKEEFYDIEDFEGYAISSFGRVWSYKSDKFLEPRLHSGGYHQVSLCRGGKAYNQYIHRLVAKYFVELDESRLEVDHIDGDKTNNHVSNLRWVTRSENSKNFDRSGRRGYTTKHMDDNTKEKIMSMSRQGYGPSEIGRTLDVPRQTVYSFLKREGVTK